MTEILMYGVVGDSWDGLDAQTLVPIINGSSDDIDVRINSAGGYVMDGLATFNALQRAKATGRKVTTHIDGLAASMASIIAMAGSEIIMADNALMMIHNPWDVAVGDAAELRAAADQLDMIRDQLVGIYAAQTGIDPADLIAMLDAETWMSSQVALEKKFVTSIAGASTAAALNVKAFGFRKVPDSPLITTLAMARAPRTAAAAPQPPKENPMPPEATPAAVTQPAIVTPPAAPAAPAAPVAVAAPAAAAPAAPSAPAGITAADVQAAIAADRARGNEIRALGAKHGLDADFIEGLVTAGTPLAEARDKMLDKLAERSDAANVGRSSINVGADARDKWLDGAAAWLMIRSGVASTVTKAAALRGETLRLDPGEFRGVSCVDLAREALINSGNRVTSRDPKAILGAAMTSMNAITQTTGDFTVLLENVMHKTLQAAYATTPDSWSKFCGTGSVTDFRAANRYLKGTFGTLDVLNEAGEFRNKAIPDGAKQTIQAGTKGNIIGISRQALINDDMGVFSGLAMDLGRAAKLTIEVDVFALLASNPVMGDGFALFDAAHHGNIAGVAAVPGVASFDAARVAMASQKDVSGNEFLDIRPQSWVGPLSLGGTVRVIIGSPYDPDAANKLQRINMVQGLVETVVDTPRLGGTAWYLFADKDVAPAIEVVFLNGVEEPFLENELGWRVDGTEFKVRLDYGVGAINWRSAYQNPGQ